MLPFAVVVAVIVAVAVVVVVSCCFSFVISNCCQFPADTSYVAIQVCLSHCSALISAAAATAAAPAAATRLPLPPSPSALHPPSLLSFRPNSKSTLFLDLDFDICKQQQQQQPSLHLQPVSLFGNIF